MITKQKWIKALRSGKYKKGKGALLRGGRHCCLGVLACEAGLEITAQNQVCGLSTHDSYIAVGKQLGFVGNWPWQTLTGANDASKRDDFEDVIPVIERMFP